MKTVFFSDCLGVFQGGGPRAAAFAGAYQVTYKAGVRFSEVAGTSAGAIAAALIGAGAEPDFMSGALQKLDFKTLLVSPEKAGSFNGAVLKAVGVAAIGSGIFSTNAGRFGRVLYNGGLHSSRGIEDWVDARLQDLLKTGRPVLFSDLKLPTHIIATDFGRQRERVWSPHVSPDTKVAFAVRASCSIPFFFQAVVEGNERLVDGGILSNLPTFVFADEHRKSGKRILAFRLQADPAMAADWSFPELIKRLVDTAISGASEIQLGLQDGVSRIDIPTGNIRATDFDRMDDDARTFLFNNGKTAAIRFIESEAIHLGRAQADNLRLWDQDRLYLEVVRQSAYSADQIILAQHDTDWYWQLFPTVLYWRLNGTRVRVLLLPASGDARALARERTRRRNLGGLGVEIQEVHELPLRAVVFCRDDQFASTAIVATDSGTVHDPIGVLYKGDIHQPAIRTIREQLAAAFKPMGAGLPYVPVIAKFDSGDLCKKLKMGVSQYTPSAVSIAIEPIAIEGARTITQRVREYKYEQILRLIDALKERGFELFDPAAVILESGEPSVIIPPVFEVHGKEFIGVEGNTRTCFANRYQVETINAVVVRNVKEPLPGKSVHVRDTSLVEESLPSEERMPGFNYSQFRRIEGACRPLDPPP